MDKKFIVVGALVGVMISGAFVSRQAVAGSQDTPIDTFKLKEIISGLGYETSQISTDVGKEKWSFKMTKGGLDVPIGAEVSPSKNYIWLTVNLGDSKSDTKYEALIKSNGEIQPAFFYVAKTGKLMMALAIDNRGVNSANMRRCAEFVSDRVVDTKGIWQQ